MNSLHYLLMKSHSLFSKRVLAEVSRIGLTPGQPKVLECLLQHGEVDQKTIAAHCEIEPATVGSILTRMERDGLIARAQHEGNRRSLYVTLTAKGQAAAQAMDRAFATADQKAAADLTQDQLQQLCCALDHVWDALTKRKEDG